MVHVGRLHTLFSFIHTEWDKQREIVGTAASANGPAAWQRTAHIGTGQTVTQLKSEGLKSRLQEATDKVVGKKLGAQMMRPLFLSWFDTKGPTRRRGGKF